MFDQHLLYENLNLIFQQDLKIPKIPNVVLIKKTPKNAQLFYITL